MADYVKVSPGIEPEAEKILSDEVSKDAETVKVQGMKIVLGADGVFDTYVDSGQQVSSASIPVVIASDQSSLTVDGNVSVTGSVTSTLASNSGVDVGDVDVVTVAGLTKGQGTMANSFPVVIASDQSPTIRTATGTIDITDTASNVEFVLSGETNVLMETGVRTGSGGNYIIQGSTDGTNWLTLNSPCVVRTDGLAANSMSPQASVYQYVINVTGLRKVRAKTNGTGTGGSTVSFYSWPHQVTPVVQTQIVHCAAGPANLITKSEDSAHASGDVGVMMLGVRNDNVTVLSDTEGDYTPINISRYGIARFCVGAEGQLTVNGGLLKAEDSAHTSGDYGVMMLGVRNDTCTAKSTTDGDYTFLSTDSAGRLEVTSRSTIITVTPTLSTAGLYAVGDVVGTANEVALAFTVQKLSGMLTNITLIDKAKQNASLTVVLFANMPTMANSDNGVFDITDANLTTSTPLGFVNISPADYITISTSNSIASVDCNKLLKSTTTSFFFAIMTNGTPTYASGDLLLSFHMAQD